MKKEILDVSVLAFFCQKIKLGSDAQNLNFSKRQNKYIMIVFVEK